EEDRKAGGHRVTGSIRQKPRPFDVFGPGMDLPGGRGRRRLGAGHVAPVLDPPAKIGQRLGKARDAIGFWPHRTAAAALAAIKRRADQDAGAAAHADTAAVTITSTSRSDPASRASPQARAGAQPSGIHSSHTAFIAS